MSSSGLASLSLAAALPVLLAEVGKAYRRHLKERRKAAERAADAKLKALEDRIARFEAAARWA